MFRAAVTLAAVAAPTAALSGVEFASGSKSFAAAPGLTMEAPQFHDVPQSVRAGVPRTHPESV